MIKDSINIFIFRRDLRIEDNSALSLLIKESKNMKIKILPIFIFNPLQIDQKSNHYYNKNAIEFMIQCLDELNSKSLHNGLSYFLGDDIDVLNRILSVYQINTVSFNCDYTPFATRRDSRIIDWCRLKNIGTILSHDYTLLPFKNVYNKAGKTYEIFTPFYNTFLTKLKDISEPLNLDGSYDSVLFLQKKKSTLKQNNIQIHNFYNNKPNYNLAVKGGRSNAIEILKRIENGEFSRYKKQRDIPALAKTTMLSAYIKFGCVSIREVFQVMRQNKDLLRELIWREFYAGITHAFPRVLKGQLGGPRLGGINHSFREKYDAIQWGYNENFWNLWCKGKTGVPFVDAGIRQLLTTGFCHNRLRMVLGMFFCKDMLMDWKLFEHWMATNLVDYDPASNSGGVQWCYSIGNDAAPYYRIFNPYRQSEKFDPQCQYIKKWIPELSKVQSKVIHNWDVEHIKHPNVYVSPMLDHSIQVEKFLKLFQEK
jgi:deoxyribodipyrimidine photo-lyase